MFVPGVTEPMLWSREQDVAFVEVQVSVEELPEVIDEGLAERVTVGAPAGAAVTVTLAVSEALPPSPVHVI